MKNVLLPVILLIVCACQHEANKPNSNILDIDNLNYGWSSVYDSITHHVTIESPWGARGWGYGEEKDTSTYFDASAYDNVVVNIEGIKGPVSKLNIIVLYADKEVVSRDLSTIVEGATTMRLDLDRKAKSKLKSVFLMSDSLCEMDIKSAYFDKAHHYGPAEELKMSNIGIISSDQFEGYSDNALVEFTFESEGEMIGVDKYGNTVNMNGWAVGIICSAADILGADLPTRGMVLKNIGVQKTTCLLGDIRYLLSLQDDDGECGIFWTVWKTGNITDIRVVSTTIAEAID
ncbi:MAG: hypothetical protein MJZ27_05860 [Bacteroidales bacterium]|nr:hypothetical protein [Bacteroidales bacterium]